jgi:hypothetical protein
MHPLYVSEFQKDRQEELISAAESWRLAHPRSRRSLRRRAGTRLIAIGSRLAGDLGPGGRS